MAKVNYSLTTKEILTSKLGCRVEVTANGDERIFLHFSPYYGDASIANKLGVVVAGYERYGHFYTKGATYKGEELPLEAVEVLMKGMVRYYDCAAQKWHCLFENKPQVRAAVELLDRLLKDFAKNN